MPLGYVLERDPYQYQIVTDPAKIKADIECGQPVYEFPQELLDRYERVMAAYHELQTEVRRWRFNPPPPANPPKRKTSHGRRNRKGKAG